MRIFTASLGTETNTYAPIPTDRSAFESTFYAPPGQHPRTPTLCSAPMVVLRRRAQEEGFELIEGTATFAEPAGLVSRQCYEGLRDEILGQLRAALPVDGVVLGLHGAMIAQGYDDCEGDLLTSIRQIVGSEVIVSAELDPHSHLTQARFDAADILVAFKEFSHVDFVERAEEVVDLSLRAMRGAIRPVMSKFDCRMIEVLPTSQEPMRSFIDKIMQLEAHSELSTMSTLTPPHVQYPVTDSEILSISCIHGFMPADVPAMGSHMLVITDGAADKGAALAEKLGMELFEMRGLTRPDYLSVEAAFDRAEEILAADDYDGRHTGDPRGPVVIADVWDNPGGGVAGDSTWFLHECMARRIPGVALATIYDPQAAGLCHAAGEGAQLQLRFGGKTAPLADSGAPIDAMVRVVRCVRDATQTYGESIVPLGDSALVEVPFAREPGIESDPAGGTMLVILNTNRTQTFNPDAFTRMGVDLAQQRILIVKSTHHFYPAFAAIAREVLYVDTGLTMGSPYPSDPTKTTYTKIERPMWPMVADPHSIGSRPVPWVRAERVPETSVAAETAQAVQSKL